VSVRCANCLSDSEHISKTTCSTFANALGKWRLQQASELLLPQPFNGLFSGTTSVSRYQKGKTSLDLNEARDDGILGCSGISWTICKQYAPRSRQINTPAPHHLIFTGRILLLTPNQQCQSTEMLNYMKSLVGLQWAVSSVLLRLTDVIITINKSNISNLTFQQHGII